MKTKFGNFKVLSLLVMAALLVPAALMGQGSKANFSGSWSYNADKSNAGQQQGKLRDRLRVSVPAARGWVAVTS